MHNKSVLARVLLLESSHFCHGMIPFQQDYMGKRQMHKNKNATPEKIGSQCAAAGALAIIDRLLYLFLASF